MDNMEYYRNYRNCYYGILRNITVHNTSPTLGMPANTTTLNFMYVMGNINLKKKKPDPVAHLKPRGTRDLAGVEPVRQRLDV